MGRHAGPAYRNRPHLGWACDRAQARNPTALVTLQDLAPFEVLESVRTEFLRLVSHELRAPLAAIKGAAWTALEDPRDPGRDELRQCLRIVEEHSTVKSRP